AKQGCNHLYGWQLLGFIHFLVSDFHFLSVQLHDGDRFPSVFLGLKGMFLDQRVRCQKLANPFAKRARSVSMNNPDSRFVRQRRVIQEFVEPGCKRSALTVSGEAFTPRSACDSAMVCKTAAFSSSRASPRTSCIFRRAVFSTCVRGPRSFTASTTRATFSSKRFCISANCASSS